MDSSAISINMPKSRKNKSRSRSRRGEQEEDLIASATQKDVDETQAVVRGQSASGVKTPTIAPNDGDININTNLTGGQTNHTDISNDSKSISHNNRDNSDPKCKTIITVGSVTPNIYDGAEDIDEYLDHFQYIAKCNNWSDRMQLNRLPIYLKGTAELWFRDFSRTSGENLTITQVCDGLREAFRQKNYRSINQNLLTYRYQGLTEPVHKYFYDIVRLCNRVNPSMSEEEKITHILRGLKSSILEKALILEPKNCKDLLNKVRSIEEAEYLSQVRPSYNNCLLNAKVQESSVATSEDKDKDICPPESEKEKSDTTELVSLMKDMLSEYKNLRSNRYKNKGNQNNWHGNQNREQGGPVPNRRTLTGAPICNYCQKPGHLERDCFKKKLDEITNVSQNTTPKQVEKGPDQGNH